MSSSTSNAADRIRRRAQAAAVGGSGAGEGVGGIGPISEVGPVGGGPSFSGELPPLQDGRLLLSPTARGGASPVGAPRGSLARASLSGTGVLPLPGLASEGGDLARLSLMPAYALNSAHVLYLSGEGQLERLKELIGTDRTLVNCADYDRRTPLHLAASEGRARPLFFRALYLSPRRSPRKQRAYAFLLLLFFFRLFLISSCLPGVSPACSSRASARARDPAAGPRNARISAESPTRARFAVSRPPPPLSQN